MNRLFTLFFSIAFFSLNVFADPISLQTAKKVGESFLTNPVSSTGMLKTKKMTINLKLIYTADALLFKSEATQSIVPFYVFGGENQGYVIVAGDDRFIPILGYADEGIFDPNNIPPNMQKWLESYKSEIRYAIDNKTVTTPEIQAQWLALQFGEPVNTQNLASSVAPLISTKWNQAPYYNDLCPYDNTDSKKTVTGCVATAMAQVMKYWKHPATGSGFHSYKHSTYGTLSANFGSTTYDWANMASQLTSASSSAQQNAVATLMYHCGVSVDMNYGVSSKGGSSAYVISSSSPVTNCAEYALKTYFGYKSSLQGVKKASYTIANWINLLKTELDAGRAMIYAGFGDGGHCFVCDGYDNNNYFHFNWGWGGSYDGYFALDALNPNSGGIGGGSYSYNDGQQAIIGIEPANGGTTSQSYDLKLYSDPSMSASKIWFTDAFSLTVNIANYGGGNFTGTFGAAVFDSNGNFVDFIETKSNMTLNANSHYTNALTFNNAGSVKFVPGKYKVAVFYKTETQDWTIVANGSYTNLKQFEIYYSSDIEAYSAFKITTEGGKLIQGKTTTVNIDVKNTGTNIFYGQFRVTLSNLDGSWAQNIQILDESKGLQPEYHYTNGNNFTGTVTVEPGTYLLDVDYKSTGTSNWYYAGSSNYSNPVYVIVEAPVLTADIYEDNDTQSKAYNLPVNFSRNTTTSNTNGSNLHLGTDMDYYKIDLPSGYNYTIAPRLYDNNKSGNEQTYTVDALFSYSTNGTTYSETYDDVMASSITVNKGGTLYFKVAPYFSGSTGTYLLELSITRSTTTGMDDIETNDQITLYPNPAKDFVTIDLHEFNSKITQITLSNVQGRQLYIESINNIEEPIILPLKDLPDGIYWVQIHSEAGINTKKIIVRK
jgi:hypothetical protein